MTRTVRSPIPTPPSRATARDDRTIIPHPPALRALALVMLLPAALTAQDPGASAMTVSDESLFAVVTHKAGLASGLAHNHFVVAPEFVASVEFDPDDPLATSFRFSTLADELEVDEPEAKARWLPRIQALGLLDRFGDVGEEDRAKIRNEMFDDDQLDPENFPVIAAAVVSVSRAPTQVGEVSFDYQAIIDVTIHGVTVRRDVPVRWEAAGTGVRIEALGFFGFEEFGIEPYSAFLGTVKNKNEFEIYVNLVAERD